MSKLHHERLMKVLDALEGISELNAIPVLLEAMIIKIADAEPSLPLKDVFFQLTSALTGLIPKLSVRNNMRESVLGVRGRDIHGRYADWFDQMWQRSSPL